ICVVNSHFPDLISPAACAGPARAATRDRASKLPLAALVIASGLFNLLKRTRMVALAFQRTRKTRSHRVRRGITAERRCDWMRPTKAERFAWTLAGANGIRTRGPGLCSAIDPIERLVEHGFMPGAFPRLDIGFHF